jgi:uncharacterized membrane protein
VALGRADILHCIGLSLGVSAIFVWGRSLLSLRALVVCAAALLLGLLFYRLRLHIGLPLAIPAALLFDVAPYTRFPLLPLCGFTAIGVAVGTLLGRFSPSRAHSLLLMAAALLLAVVAYFLTQQTLLMLGGSLNRGHPAVVFNFIDGSARALAVLFGCLGFFGAASPGPGKNSWVLSAVVRLGRGSLLAYAFHIPFCYSRIAAPIHGRLDMGRATLVLLGLIALTFAIVYTRDRLRTARRTA